MNAYSIPKNIILASISLGHSPIPRGRSPCQINIQISNTEPKSTGLTAILFSLLNFLRNDLNHANQTRLRTWFRLPRIRLLYFCRFLFGAQFPNPSLNIQAWLANQFAVLGYGESAPPIVSELLFPKSSAMPFHIGLLRFAVISKMIPKYTWC